MKYLNIVIIFLLAISCNKATVDIEVYNQDNDEPVLEPTNTIQYLSTDIEYNTLIEKSNLEK